ncbi:MAG: hypothetical protein ABI358_10170 [Ginsengibacter sp.]
MENETKQTRKKFIGASISAAALLTAFKFFIPGKKKQSSVVKMLTQDGTLVEVNVAALPRKKKKITNKEMQSWIKPKEV